MSLDVAGYGGHNLSGRRLYGGRVRQAIVHHTPSSLGIIKCH